MSRMKLLNKSWFLSMLMAHQVMAQTPEPPTAPVPIAAPTISVSKDILFQNVRVFDGQSAKVSEPMNVLVRDNKIQTISRAPITAQASAQVIEGRAEC